MYRAELIVRESAGAMYQARSVWYIVTPHRTLEVAHRAAFSGTSAGDCSLISFLPCLLNELRDLPEKIPVLVHKFSIRRDLESVSFLNE